MSVSQPPLPSGYAARRARWDLEISRADGRCEIGLILAPADLRLLAGLLTAPNAAEIGAWLAEQAAALDRQP